MFFLPLLTVIAAFADSVNVGVKVEGIQGETKIRICEIGYQNFEDLEAAIDSKYNCTYVKFTCKNIGQRSELFLSCTGEDSLSLESFDFTSTVNDTDVGYTVSLSNTANVTCEGSLEWNEAICGCKLGDKSSLNVNYEKSMNVDDYINPDQNIKMSCTTNTFFEDYTTAKEIPCGVSTDLASYRCQSSEALKEFDNKVAHFEGTLKSYIIMDSPFSQELSEFALCFWLRTKDAVGSVFSLANEDHWNALRFDTHQSHIHFTMVGLHTDHGLVSKIALKDDYWRYFCANWNSDTGNATLFVRKHGDKVVDTFSEILPLSIGKNVRATGGMLALGNLWKEDVVEMSFNPIGSLEGDVMGLTLFNESVDKDTFNEMFDGCSTILDQKKVVLSWKSLLNPKNELRASATYGQQVCSTGYQYGEDYLNFPLSLEKYKLSNNQKNYAKIENAFSTDLTAFTICTLIKSDVKIGTIFSYVTTVNGFKEQIVLEKHKTHMHFYMAGIDQQVGAVPGIPIDMKRWYTTCFSWDTSGQWKGYLDGEPEVCNNKGCSEVGGSLEYTVGKTIEGGGTVYLGILKSFNSFREFRGYGGDITELNLWGKALTPRQIKEMVNSNEVHEDDLLVSWGTLLKSKRGNMAEEKNDICPAPTPLANGSFSKTGKVVASKLFEPGDEVQYKCELGWTLAVGMNPVKACNETSDSWTPVDVLICQTCKEAGMFVCGSGACLPDNQLCDGIDDCVDGSDESDCASKNQYWIAIGVLIAILLLVLPLAFLAKKARAARAEMLRVKLLTDSYEVKREHLRLENKLGEGAFGKVFKGQLLTKPDYDSPVVVAVKELSDIATERDKNMFLEEIRLSKKLGNHPNIVGIVGSIIVYEPSCLILEFVDGGDLLEYLQRNKDDPLCDITAEDQVFFAWQIANGMEYVSGKNFVHRDLAARNVLISTSKQCKVTDFGLARDLYNYDEYQSEGGRLPIKWMSPEAIFDLKFTTESDVWSFGVVMYELFSWGGSPYPGIDPSLLRDRLVNGFRMSAPNNTPDFIYSIMLQCWEFKSADRPRFTEIRRFLEPQIADYVLFKKFQETAASENVGDTYINCETEDTPLTGALHQDGDQAAATNNGEPSGKNQASNIEYNNLTFQGDETVVFKNDYEENRGGSVAAIHGQSIVPNRESAEPEEIQYAEVELQRDIQNDRQVNIGFADEKGMVEISRTDYMNT